MSQRIHLGFVCASGCLLCRVSELVGATAVLSEKGSRRGIVVLDMKETSPCQHDGEVAHPHLSLLARHKDASLGLGPSS